MPIYNKESKAKNLNKFYNQQITLFTKSVIFVVTSIILTALIYSSAAGFVVFAQNDPVSPIDCKEANFFSETCCWWNDFGDYVSYVCQICYDTDGDSTNGYEDCNPPVKTDPRDV
jgi:hypothetical protein